MKVESAIHRKIAMHHHIRAFIFSSAKGHRAVLGALVLCVCLGGARPCWAKKDVRFALLVGNQEGWKQEPRLRYVIRGDLLPMRRKLMALGFEVRVLKNQSASALRRVLNQMASELRAKQVTTFLFYYTGHAGPSAFHLGPRGRRPLRYHEFLQRVLKLPVRRRFVVLDACFSGEVIRLFGSLARFRKLFQDGAQGKGIRRRIQFDLKKHLPNQGHRTRGLQIVGSSLSLSFESRRRQASAFTFHLLQGLKGRADLDQDGKISFDEMFLYAQREVKRETGQRPQRLLLAIGSEPYGFAPAYTSRALFEAKVQGRLQISSKNFVWQHHKTLSRRLLLAVPAGRATIEMTRKGRCFRQDVSFIPGRTVRVRAGAWRAISCRLLAQTQKGRVRVDIVPAPPSPWTTAVQAGLLRSEVAGRFPMGGASWLLQHRYFGFRTALWGTSATYGGLAHGQLALELEILAGMPLQWRAMHLFCGIYAGALLLWQDFNRPSSKFGALLDLGVAVQPTFWFAEQWGVSAEFRAGLLLGDLQRFAVFWNLSASIGLRYRF